MTVRVALPPAVPVAGCPPQPKEGSPWWRPLRWQLSGRRRWAQSWTECWFPRSRWRSPQHPRLLPWIRGRFRLPVWSESGCQAVFQTVCRACSGFGEPYDVEGIVDGGDSTGFDFGQVPRSSEGQEHFTSIERDGVATLVRFNEVVRSGVIELEERPPRYRANGTLLLPPAKSERGVGLSRHAGRSGNRDLRGAVDRGDEFTD